MIRGSLTGHPAGEMESSEMGEIPSGWRVGEL